MAIVKPQIRAALVVFSITFLLFVLWLILYPAITANNSIAISLRNFYFKKITPIIYSDSFIKTAGLVPTNFRAYSYKNGLYGYVSYGKYSRIDFKNKILYLKGNNGNEYAFKINLPSILYRNNFTYYTRNSFWPSADGKPENITIDPNNQSKNINPFNEGTFFEVYWQDTKSLVRILSEAKKNNPVILNTDPSSINSIVNIILN